MTDYRAVFDADISFLNEGGMQIRGFRLDVDSGDVEPAVVGQLLIGHLGLLMVGAVAVRNLRIVEEAHKGSRDAGTCPTPAIRQLIDLSHPIVEGMVTYPGLPGPEITPHLSRAASRHVYADGVEFSIDRITMVGNTGTYLDSPFHRFDGGIDLAGLPLASVADLPALRVHLTGSGERGIGVNALASLHVTGKAVLLHTGWDRAWGTPEYAGPAPYLTAEATRWLVHNGAALVGIDSVNIDNTHETGERPAHTGLLAAMIPVLEHLTNLGEVPATGGRLHTAPAPVRGMGTFPVRAYVVVEA